MRGLAVAAPALVLTLSDLRTRMHDSEGVSTCPHDLADLTHLPTLRETFTGLDVSLRARGERVGTVAELAQDCGDLAAWLESRGALCSAAGYAEAAAALEPESAGRALVVARLARDLGRLPEAGAWGVWAARLAGRSHDPAARAAALVELGHLSATRQQYAEAGRLFALARRFAASRGLREGEGDALRGLALLRYAHGADEEALDLFRKAVAAYEPGSLAVVDLGHLVVSLCLDAREYRGAALLGRVLLARSCDAQDALGLAGLLARAAAALGWELTYESACQRAHMCLGKLPPDTPRARPLLDLARAHGSMGYWPRVELTADMARVEAERTGDDDAAFVAKRMLALSLRKKMPAKRVAELFPDLERREIPEGKEYPRGHPVRGLVESFRAAYRSQPAR